MRKAYAGLGAVLVIVSSGAVAGAATPRIGTGRDSSNAGICQKTAFEAPGGYFSAGNFYSDATATATITVHWCYLGGSITSHHVSFETSITPSQGQLTNSVSLNSSRTTLTIQDSGTFATGIVNNTGVITLSGTVDANGNSDFVNASSAGG
jgi:hypothetical protein